MWWGQGTVKIHGKEMTITIPAMSGWIWGASSN
jgi:hypothetical protein